ncbi:MAG: hypothetical protein H6842_03135 [Rhodospirillaceae bacterium]|nr:hypothetical protein [Rhodospirillaceae bacterium]
MTTHEIRIPALEQAASRRAARRSLAFALPWVGLLVVASVGLWAFAA